MSVAGLCFLQAVSGKSLPAQTDPSGDWKTWHTRHFRIHAKSQDSAMALEAAVEAERAYALLASELAQPRGKIDLVLAGNLDVSNAFTSFFPSNRITLYLTPPAGNPVLGNYDNWLRVVLVHELTHAFHLDRSLGVWQLPQYIFGRWPAFFPNAYRPSWVSEGLATYYESRLTGGGRLKGGLHGQLLAAAAMKDWPDANDATLLSPKWPAGFRPYAWGSYFFQLQARERGDSVPAGFVERTAKRLWPFSISGPLRGAGGLAVKEAWGELHRQWRDSVVQLASASPRTDRRIVARGLRTLPRPRVSPGGRYLAYVHADGKQDPQVRVLERGSGKVRWARRINGAADLAWQDSALWISQLDFTSPVEIRSRLYRWIPGGSFETVSGSERLARPFAYPGSGVGAVDLGAGSARLVAVSEGAGASIGPLPAPAAGAWGYVAASPDGEWMAGARHLEGRWDLVLWRKSDPGQAVEVTRDPALDDDPAWSPDGGLVVFTSERSGLPQIFAYRVRDGMLLQLTDEPTGARDPAIAPDGMLYFSVMLDDGFALVEQPVAEKEAAAAVLQFPAPPAAVLESVAVTRGGYSPWPSLRPHYWIPTWHDAGLAGKFAGFLTSGADAIGRTSYGLHFALAPGKEGRAEGRMDVTHQRWKSIAVLASGSQTWEEVRTRAVVSRDGGSDTLPVVLGLRERDLQLSALFSFRRWRTSLSARAGPEFEEDFFTVDSSGVSLRLRHPVTRLAGGSLGFGVFHAKRPALAISPENGVAVSAVYRRLYELPPLLDPSMRRWFEELRGAAAGYLALPLPGFAHWVLAARVAGGAIRGPLPRSFELGGTSGDRFELFPGYLIGTGRRSFPLRGYPVGGGFTRVFAGTVELRVPVALVAEGIWELPLGLDRLSVTLFGDAGGGWRSGEPMRPFALKSLGGELVLDLAVTYDVPVRMRVGAATPLSAGLGSAPGEVRWYLTFGSSF
ncbi:Protein TolB [bacterium HR33]|nr:Protein TolB [bacterium HR33]